MKTSNKITITKIAEKSGVSIATVSRILNGKGTVKQDTKNKVLSVIEQLEKEYGTTANLRNQTRNSIILLIAESDSPILTEFSTGLHEAAYAKGYQIIIIDYLQIKNNFLETFQSLSKIMPIAGLIMHNCYESQEVMESIAVKYPVIIAFNSQFKSDIISALYNDNYAACQMLCQYLLSIGKRHFAIMSLNDEFKFSTDRERGVLDTLHENGLDIPDNWIVRLPTLNTDLAVNEMDILLSGEQRPDAVIAINDTLAAACLKVALDHDLNVPEEIAITGFDNAPISSMVIPNITTMAQPGREIGIQAVNLLIEKINNPSLPTKHLTFKNEFLVRQSTQK